MAKRTLGKLGKINRIEAAKEAALQAHLRDTLAKVVTPQPQIPASTEKKKRKPGPKNSLPVDSTPGESSQKPLALAPHMRAYQYFALGYSIASIARTLDVSDGSVRHWRDTQGWVAKRDAAMIEAETHRAVQIGTLKDKGFIASNMILDHVAEALDPDLRGVDPETGQKWAPDAEDLRDYATAVEKSIKIAYPQEGIKVGVQVVNIADAIEESRRFDPPRPPEDAVDAEVVK